jgi:hypothetical protein
MSLATTAKHWAGSREKVEGIDRLASLTSGLTVSRASALPTVLRARFDQPLS